MTDFGKIVELLNELNKEFNNLGEDSVCLEIQRKSNDKSILSIDCYTRFTEAELTERKTTKQGLENLCIT